MTIQQRRERLNRQINERLRTLIAAYKTLGGSFTGNLMADPRHQAIASRLVKEIARLDGAIDSFVSPAVAEMVRAKVKG